MRTTIEALYIFDQHNDPILEHTYRSRPAASRTVLPLYLAHAAPRPSLIYLPNINPSTLLFSLIHSGLLFLSPLSADTEPLFVLEFLHRVVDVLEEFLGAPLLASKIEGAYDVVAQLLGEMCDAGSVCNTEPNALRDVVEIPGWMGKLLGGVSLPGSSPALNPSTGFKQQLSLNPSPTGPAIPWRRANVRHTSNELYVDIIETLSITLAPSGLPLAAFAHGTIAFTSKISGVPDLLLTLSTPGGKAATARTLDLPVFHPCVRLARWRDKPGELSFVPPDGKFILAGYEVDLLPQASGGDFDLRSPNNLHLPVSIEVATSLGPSGTDFEARLHLSHTFAGSSGPASRLASRTSTPAFGSAGSSSAPTLADVVVTIPISPAVRNITDLRASRGEAHFSPADHAVEWRVPTKDAAAAGSATLRCTVIGPLSNDADDDDDAHATNGFRFDAASGEYDDRDEEAAYQSTSSYTDPVAVAVAKPSGVSRGEAQDHRRVAQNKPLMPHSARVSFSVKGWLASGVRVEGLVVDARKSRGLGEGVRPYKGVKYLTVSRGGWRRGVDGAEMRG